MPTRREFLTQTAAATVVAATSAQIARARAKRGRPKDGVLRLALVGAGKISPRYLKQAAVSPKARFVATCAQHLDSAKARAVEYGIGAWFDDYKVMYDTVKPDGVVVITPHSLHAAPTIAALERGIAVLCEKPMATTWADCQAMVEASRRSGAIFLSLPYDASPQFLAALNYLNEATLGVFTGAEAQLLWPGPPWDNWFYDRNVVGGGAGLEPMVYPVSRLIGLMGPARRVTGFVNNLIPHRILGDESKDLAVVPPRAAADGKTVDTNVDDNASLVIEWPGGQQALARAMWQSSMFRSDTAIYGRRGSLWIANDGGVIVHSPEKAIPGAEAITWNGYASCYRVPYTPLKDLAHEGLIDHFADCIEGRAQPTCGGQQQLHVHEILFKGYEAARTGMAQQLETTFMPWHPIDPAFLDTRSRPI